MLNREPMGMKRHPGRDKRCRAQVSVLNREPMGMKPKMVNLSAPSW